MEKNLKELLDLHWDTVQKFYKYKNKETGENRKYHFSKEEHSEYFTAMDKRAKEEGEQPNFVFGLLSHNIHASNYEMETGEELWYHFGA